MWWLLCKHCIEAIESRGEKIIYDHCSYIEGFSRCQSVVRVTAQIELCAGNLYLNALGGVYDKWHQQYSKYCCHREYKSKKECVEAINFWNKEYFDKEEK